MSGPAGVGKTCLVHEWACEVAPEGQWGWVDLRAAAAADQVVPLVLSALDITAPTSDDETALRALAAQLSGRGWELLVLDNLDRFPAQGAAIAAALLPSTSVRVAVTTRRRGVFDSGLELSLRPFDTPDSGLDSPGCALFLDRARTHLPARPLTPLEQSYVVEIVQQLEGLPLAIELTAARLRLLGLADIAARMDRILGLARGPGRSLRTAIEASWECLSTSARRTAARCSVFEAPFGLSDAEGVLGGPADDVLDDLDELVGICVLEASRGLTTRFRMHAAVRAFAGEMLSAFGDSARSEIQAQHAEHFGQRGLRLIREAERSRDDIAIRELSRLVPELQSAVRAVHTAQDARSHVANHALCAGVALDVLMQRRGIGIDESTITELIRISSGSGSPELLVELSLGSWRRLRRSLGAEDRGWYLDRADEAASRSGDANLIGQVASARAIELWTLGDREASRVQMALALGALEGGEDLAALARARLTSAWFQHDHGNVDEPLKAIEENLGVLERAGRWYEVLLHGLNLAALSYQIGAVDAAFDRAATLRSLAESLASDTLHLHALRIQASAAILVRPEEVAGLLTTASVVGARLGAGVSDEVATVEAWGILFDGDDHERALHLLRTVVEHRRQTNATRMLVYALQSLAEALLVLEQPHQARPVVEEALSLAQATDHRPPQIILHCLRAACVSTGDDARADIAAATTSAEGADVRTRVAVELERVGLHAQRETSLDATELEVVSGVLRPLPPPADPHGVPRPFALRSRYMRATTRRVLRSLSAADRAKVWAGALDADQRAFFVSDSGHCRLPGGEWIDLSSRQTLARVLAHIAHANAGASSESCVEAGWPGEQMQPSAASTRLYQVIKRLRGTGIGALLVRGDSGYRVDPAVHVATPARI